MGLVAQMGLAMRELAAAMWEWMSCCDVCTLMPEKATTEVEDEDFARIPSPSQLSQGPTSQNSQGPGAMTPGSAPLMGGVQEDYLYEVINLRVQVRLCSIITPALGCR